MARGLRILTVMGFLASTPLVAQAAPLPPEWAGMAGTWTLEEEDGETFSCDITLLDEQGIGGYNLVIPDACADRFPTSEIAGWRINTETYEVEFIDALRQTVLTLGEMGDGGLYGSDIADPPQYFLVRAEQ